MPNIFLEILLILVLILINGFFSMSEIALVSARKVRLEQRADEGDEGAKNALKLKESTDRMLAAVQVGITMVGIFSGALGGATLAERLSQSLVKVPWLAPVAGGVAVVLVALATTYFSLVIGELIPKQLALNNPEDVASSISGTMRFVSWITSPVIKLLTVSTDLGLRILRAKPSEEPPITEDEIKVLMEQGAQVGVFDETEQDMVEGVFRLNDRSIDSIMTPRTEIEWLDLNDSPEEIFKQIQESTHSRFPVARESVDNVIGILNAKDLLEQKLNNQPFDLASLVSKPLFVPESTTASKVLEMSKKAGVHEVLVIDEYGGLLGMVTLFDVLEAIVGGLPTQDESFRPEITRREDGSYLLDGLLSIDDLKKLMDIDELPEEEKIGYQTVGGFVMSQLNTIPSAGQHFHLGDFRFEVMDMDGRRVDKILLTRHPAEPLTPKALE